MSVTDRGASERTSRSIDPETFTKFLGQATWLMTQSKEHKELRISDIEARILPALLLKQFRLYASGEKPIAFITWASVSNDVKSRFKDGSTPLTLEEWRSGDNILIVDCISPFGPQDKIIAQFNKSVKKKSD